MDESSIVVGQFALLEIVHHVIELLRACELRPGSAHELERTLAILIMSLYAAVVAIEK